MTKTTYKTAPEQNPTGPSSGSDRRVLRGGSWVDDDPDNFRAANRLGYSPTTGTTSWVSAAPQDFEYPAMNGTGCER